MNSIIAYAEYNGTGGIISYCPTSADIDSLTTLINFVTCTIMNAIIPLLVAVAVAAFIWGIIQFYLNPENEEKRKKGKSFIIGGLIALFVMTSIWGLVAIFSNSFNTGPVVIPILPEN